MLEGEDGGEVVPTGSLNRQGLGPLLERSLGSPGFDPYNHVDHCRVHLITEKIR